MSLIIPKKPLTKPKGKETQKVMAMMKSELREEGVVIINDRGINKCNFKELLSYYFHTFKRDPVVRFRVRNTKVEPEKKNIPRDNKLFIIERLKSLGETDPLLSKLSIRELVNIHIAITRVSQKNNIKAKYVFTPHSIKSYIKKLEKKNKANAYKEKYREYLLSPEWRNKRKEVLIDRNNKCERCGSNNRLEVHHKTYERIFNEDLSDLELLCKPCHKKEHNIVEELQTA